MLTFCAWLMLAAAADPRVEQGEKLYNEGEYLGAARLLERVLASGTASATRARLYLAAAHFAAGDRDAANRVLTALFADDPTAQIDADQFPPPFVQALEGARPGAGPPADEPARILVAPAAQNETSAPQPRATRPSRVGFIPLIAGVAAVGVGAFFLAHAQSIHATLTTAPTGPSDTLPFDRAQALGADGNRSQVAGWALIWVGVAALVTAAALFLFVRAESI